MHDITGVHSNTAVNRLKLVNTNQNPDLKCRKIPILKVAVAKKWIWFSVFNQIIKSTDSIAMHTCSRAHL